MHTTQRQRMQKLTIVLFLTVSLLCLVPSIASAGGLWDGVSCTGVNCELCNVVQLGNAVLVWLIGVLFVVFGVVAVIAGFNLVTSAGNPAGKSAAKDKLINAVIGLIIVFAAWMIVDTIMRTLDGGVIEYQGYKALPWNRIECGLSTPANIDDEPNSTFDAVNGVGNVPTGAANSGSSGNNSGYQGTINGGNSGSGNSNLGADCNPNSPNFPACAG